MIDSPGNIPNANSLHIEPYETKLKKIFGDQTFSLFKYQAQCVKLKIDLHKITLRT